MYNNAQPSGNYDKLMVLQNDSIYTGGFIQDVEKVCIQGNGAIIDLRGETIGVDGKNKEIEIHHTIFISTLPNYFYVRLKNSATGHFINNTFYSIQDSVNSDICLKFEECTTNYTDISNNIFVNFNSAVYFFTTDHNAPIALNISNNDIWQCDYGYEYWGGWTGDPMPFVPSPGNSEIIDDPLFVDPSNLDFNIQSNSPCIDRGIDKGYEFSSFDPDLGAKESEYSNFIGTKISGTLYGDLLTDNSPYIVEDDIIIPQDKELKIHPGTVLKINASKSILVYGTLILEGTDSDSIFIQQNSIYKKYWGGIVFYPEATGQSLISKVSMSNGASLNEKGVIHCLNDSIIISSNCFTNSTTSIYCDSNSCPIISNNIFKEVSNFTGIRAIYCAPGSKPIIENNEFYCSCVYCLSAKPVIRRNKFLGQTYWIGQQYWFLELLNNSDAYLEANLFRDNSFAVEVASSTCSSYNDLIYNCEDAYLFIQNAQGRIYNNTIYNIKYVGLRSVINSTVNITNSIVWKYDSLGYSLQAGDSSKIYADHCILSDQFDGTNINYEDPLFVNPSTYDFHLSSESPAINSGTIDTAGLNIPQTDYDGKERVINGRIDIGCFEFKDVDAVNICDDIPNSFFLRQNYPNPFNPETSISYSLPARSRVHLYVYNILGQVVADLVDTEQQAGIQSVVWSPNVASGLYFYRLEAVSMDNPGKRFVETKKMILLK